jgi:hypothetical protein
MKKLAIVLASTLLCTSVPAQESQLPIGPQLPAGGGGGGTITGSFTAGNLLVGNSLGQIVDPSAIAATYPANGVIETLGTVTGGSSYTTGTQILTLGLTITAGSLYVDGTYTAVPLTGGTGSGAQATIIVLNGAVVSVALTGSADTGYVAADSLSASNANLGGAGSGFSIPVSTVGYRAVPLTGGTGSGATATIRVAAGAVAAVTITNRGTGYLNTDSLSATAASIGGTGSGFLVAVSKVGGTTTAGTGGTYYTNTISGNCAVAGTCFFNTYAYNTDTVDASAAANGVVGWNWSLRTGGGRGGRVTGQYTLNLNVAPLDTAQNYVALGTIAQASVNAGGASGAGNGLGDLFGSNPYCRLVSGATFWKQCVGQEIDISVQYGASVDQLVGLQVVQDSVAKVPANQVAIAYSANNALAAGSVAGWDILYSDGAYAGFPALKTTGTIFKCYAHANSGNCGTIGVGFDLTNYGTITNNAFASPGFSVSGTGAVTGTNINVTATTVPTNGMYLPSTGLGFSIGSTAIAEFISTNNGLMCINCTAAINTGDQVSITGTGGVARGMTLRNTNNANTAQEILNFGNDAAASQAKIILNSSTFSGGQGANALQISNTSTAPIVIGTGTEVIKLPSVTTGTPAASLCIDASNNVIKKTTTGSCV